MYRYQHNEEIIGNLSEQSGESAEELTEGVNTILKILRQKGIIVLFNTPLSQGISPAKSTPEVSY